MAPDSITRLASFVILATVCSAAQAATPAAHRYADVEAGSRSLPLFDDAGSRQTPFAEISIYQSVQRSWTIVTFYLMFRETADEETIRRDSYWVARRLVGSDAGKALIVPTIDWAISDDCPDLDGAVRSMDEAIAPRVELVIPGEGDPSELVRDPTRYWLWSRAGRFQGTPYAARFSVTSNGVSPVSAWIDATVTRLQPCWTNAAPAGANAISPAR
jgi:hypothetical protein